MGSIITDASGTGDGYGIGVLIEPSTCFQVLRSLYAPLLLDIFSSTTDPLHIMYQELMAYLLAI